MKLFLYSLGILQKQELEHQTFKISHFGTFGVPSDLIDAVEISPGIYELKFIILH